MTLPPATARPSRRKQCWAVLAASIVALCLLFPLSFGGPVVFSPYRRRWRRYLSAAAMARLEREKAGLERYAPEEAPPPVWVLSMPSAARRRAAANASLAGIDFQFVEAVDGEEGLPPGELRLLLGGPRLRYAERGDAFARRKLAIDLSHFRLLFRLLATGCDAAVVLEDDAEPAVRAAAAKFHRRLANVLSSTPADWDILYLARQGVRRTSKEPVGPGVRAFWDGSGTLAYVARRSLAVKVLEEAVRSKSWLNIDLLYTAMIQAGEVAAYVADPPLVVRGAAAGGSTVGYEEQRGRGIIAEKLLDGPPPVPRLGPRPPGPAALVRPAAAVKALLATAVSYTFSADDEDSIVEFGAAAGDVVHLWVGLVASAVAAPAPHPHVRLYEMRYMMEVEEDPGAVLAAEMFGQEATDRLTAIMLGPAPLE